MHSLTYQELPQWLAEPLEAQVISLPEAAELWDLFVVSPNQPPELPPRLLGAVQRLHLWQWEVPEDLPVQ